MYRETIEHPASIPDPIKAHLDLTSGKDRGRIYELVPEGFRPAPRFNLETATTAELVNLLSHPDGWWRETAQRLLIEQLDRETVPMLRNVLASTHSALGRAHAVWTLHALGALTASDAISLAADREPRLRELAAKILAPFAEHDGAAEQALVTLASDDDRGVVFEAAITLGDLVGERPLNAFAAIARSHPANAWVRAAVLSGLRGRAGGLAANLRADGFFQSRAGAEWLAGLAPLVGAQRDNAQVAEFVRQLTETGVDEPTRLGALLGIARGMARTGRTLGELEQSGVRAVIEQSTRDAARLAAGAEDDAARLLAIRYLGVAEAEDSSSVLEALLDQREPVSIQLEAVRALMGGAGAEATRLVLERWPSLSPIVRGEAIEQILGRSRNVDLVLDAIEGRAISPADFPAARRGALLEHRDAATRERARRLLSEGRGEGRLEVLARYQGSLKLPGEAERGRAVFQRVCATCHAVGGQGHSVGPDIATVAHGSNEELVNHILDPNREVAPAYVGYVVATSDGRTFTGVIAEESSNSITLKRAEGVTDVVARSMIEEIRSTEASIMPEGLENDLSTQDLADLLLYVHTLTPAATNAR
jgi:putative heme-binding domain-containing protein